MEHIDQIILEWDEKFDRYIELSNNIQNLLSEIDAIKNNLDSLLGNQKEEDIGFYKALIENSLNYYKISFKIRKTKMLKDITTVWQKIDERKKFEEINKSNFQSFIKDFKKFADDANQARKNNTILSWVKNDRVENIALIEADFNEILNYHLKLIDYFNTSVQFEKIFFAGK